MIKLGDYNTLKIVKSVDFGLYLDGGEEGEILLPQRYVTNDMKIGDEITVFIYLDQEERPVATTETPFAKVGEFVSLEVAWVNQFGAFLNWGLMKDIFCPFREQKKRMEQGQRHIVYIKVDEDSYRLMATAKVEKYLTVPTINDLPQLQHGAEVDILVWQKTDLGFKVIVNNQFQGLVFDNQIFQSLHSGMKLKAFVDHVRQDGKIDIVLQQTGRQQTLDFAETLLRYLYENDGYCNLGDKSPAELIYDRVQVSKKAFKKAVGDLYKRRLITIADDGIHLAK